MTKYFFIFFLLLPFLGQTQIVKQNINTDNRMKVGIDSIVQKSVTLFMSDTSKVGLSAGVYKNGKIYSYNYGSSLKVKQKLPTNNTIYEIGSISKTFTGTLLAQAICDKKVAFEDDIRKYMEGSYPNLEYQRHPITIANLVNHTSGLPYFLPDKPEILNTQNYDSLIANIQNVQRKYSRQDFFKDLHKVRLDTIPGFKNNYSNSAVQLLGYVLEKIYKMPYKKLVQTYLSIPLKLNNTGLNYSNIKNPNLAKGYNGKGKQMSYMEPIAGGAGGIHSTVNDMLSYIKYQLNETDKSVALSHKITWGDINDYAIGIFWDENKTPKGYKRILHSGGTYGFSSYCVIYPELNIGIVLLTNEADQTAQGWT